MNDLSVSTLSMSRDEWREHRRKGIGGSDAAAIMDMNPWMSPLAVYMDKLGLAPEKDETEAMRQGTDLEEYVAYRFFESTGKKVRRCNKILQHPEHAFMLANVDRMVVGENAGLECKTTSVYNKSEFDQGDIPATYYWQCMHYMAVTGADRWYLAVLVLNSAFHTFCIERNEDHIAVLIDIERTFWNDHVLAEVPPYPDGSDKDDDLILYAHPQESSDELIYAPALVDDIEQVKLLEADRKRLKTYIKQAKQRIKETIGDDLGASCEGWRVTWKAQDTHTIDTVKLRAEMPDIAAKYTKVTTTRVLRFKEVDERETD